MSRLDSVSLEIIWTRLIAIADEAAITLVRSSFAPVVRESNDYSCVLFDAKGNVVAENTTGIPSFNTVISRTLKHFLDVYPREQWVEGDVGITNDPWIGSGHLPDVIIVMPIFLDGILVGWTGSIAHKTDIGGSIWSADTRDVFEEGLRIPPMKLFEAGEINEVLMTILKSNIRLPVEVVGDIMAQVNAGKVAGERLVEMMRDESLDSIDEIAEEIQNRAEQVMRQKIRELPDGVYKDVVYNDGKDGEPIRIACTITIQGDEMIVDYEGSSPQVGYGVNNVWNYTNAYTCYPIKCALDPITPRNEGSYRPITVKAPKDSVLNATFPAPVYARQLVGHCLTTAVYGALKHVIPNQIIADSGSTPTLRVLLNGEDQEGNKYTAITFLSGGMGARPNKDGLSCMTFPTTTFAGSMEIIEAASPIRIWKRELRPDSGGAGQYRGGLGQDLELELVSGKPAMLSLFVDRKLYPARGFFGGHDGAPSEVSINDREDGFPVKGRSMVQSGDRIKVRYPGGGGYGDPARRDREQVKRDLKNGYITKEAAIEIYGLEKVEDHE